MAATLFGALLNLFILLLCFDRLRVFNVTIYSPSVDKVSTASDYAYLRFDEGFELEFVSTCWTPIRVSLPRSLGFNRSQLRLHVGLNMDKQLWQSLDIILRWRLLFLWIFQSILAQFFPNSC